MEKATSEGCEQRGTEKAGPLRGPGPYGPLRYAPRFSVRFRFALTGRRFAILGSLAALQGPAGSGLVARPCRVAGWPGPGVPAPAWCAGLFTLKRE